MSEVIDLLEEKNICLRRFIEINERQMQSLDQENYDELESFYSARENILDIIQRVDEMIGLASLSFDESGVDLELQKEIENNISEKNDLVKRILAQDLEILSRIDRAKSKIIVELSEVQSGRKAIGAYKSGQVNKSKMHQKA